MFTERKALMEQCLRDLRQWPGCECVREIGILSGKGSDFQVRIVDYGPVRKRLADRAARCVEREARRYYRLTSP
jgi:hypothetical protein